MKIIEDNENSLLNRKEVKVIVEAARNPSFEEASKLISDKFKVNEELIAMKNVKGKFGRKTFLISALIYKSKEDKDKIEKVKVKKEETKEQKAEEKSAEQKPAEKIEEKK